MPEDAVIETSSPSTPEPEAVPYQEISLDSLTDEQDKHWRLTGELPKAKSAAPPPAKKTDEPPPEGGEARGRQEAGKGKGVKARSSELDAEIQELEAKLARRNDLKRQTDSETGVKPASPAAEKPAELKQPVRPKSTDFNGPDAWEQYEEAKLKYAEDLADYKADVKLQAYRSEQQAEAAKAKQEADAKPVADRWNQQVDKAAKKYGVDKWDEAAKAVFPLLTQDRRMAVAADFVLDSEVGAEISYYLGTHLDEANAIAEMKPSRQAAALRDIEISLTEPAARREPPAPKRQTEVGPPPTDLQARNAPPKDAVQAALESGDTEAYIKAANARDVAAKRRVFGR